jgi:SAM-dependent methyltransferase
MGSRPARPRYDGIGEWYDREVRSGPAARISALAVDTAARLLGPGPGRCLDVACGTGIAIPALASLGWVVTGVDVSKELLGLAADHLDDTGVELVEGDAAALPFPDGSFDGVVLVLASTDLDDVASAFREAARVLVPGGRFVLVGTHPCFVTPVAVREPDGGRVTLLPGYRQAGWWAEGPGFGQGIRPRVGVHHLPLATLLTAVLDAGIGLERIEEPGDEDYPILLALAGRTSSGARSSV